MSGVVERFFDEGNEITLGSLPSDLREVLEPWAGRADKGDAIAFLPRAADERLWWYGFAPDGRARRELLGFLDAWIGPTASDLVEQRGRLDPSDAFDSALAALCPGRLLRFEVLPRHGSHATQAKLDVRHALRRMVRMLDERPPSEFQAARSAAEILEDLAHALSTRERDLATALLDELRTGGDLDEMNLAFLRLRVHAGLALWDEVLRDRALPEVMGVRRPPGVTRALQQALYGAYLARLDVEERDDALLTAFHDVHDQFPDLGKGSPTPKLRAELVVQFLFALKEGSEVQAGLIDRLLAEADGVEIGLRERLLRLQSATAPEPAPAPALPQDPVADATSRWVNGDAMGALKMLEGLPPSLAVAKLAASAAADVGTRDAALLAKGVLDAEPGLREQVVASGAMGRSAIETVENLTAAEGPDSWGAWFERLEGGASRGDAIRWARESAEDWAPLAEPDVGARLAESPDVVLEALGEVAGSFLNAHETVLDGQQQAQVAERLLTALALSGRTSPGVQVQTLNLIDVLLGSGPTAEQVVGGLEALEELRSTMTASGTIDWQVDLLQTVAYHPVPPDAEARRLEYLHSALDNIRRFRTALDRTALESIAATCGSLSVHLPGDIEALRTADFEGEEDLYGCLAGKKVVLHSLMESATRRAADTLRRVDPSLDVTTNADHVGTDRLADLSQCADVFLMVTAASKHAATEFIEKHRAAADIIYVHTKGSSALLRSLAAVCQ